MKNFFCFILVFLGCHVTSYSDDQKTVDPTSVMIEERFENRWQALIQKDFESAYNYEEPSYRKDVDLASYKKSYDPRFEWKAVNLKATDVQDGRKAVIKYSLDAVFNTDWGVPLESTSFHSEEWVFIDDEWWHIRDLTSPSDNNTLNVDVSASSNTEESAQGRAED